MMVAVMILLPMTMVMKLVTKMMLMTTNERKVTRLGLFRTKRSKKTHCMRHRL